MDELRWFTVKKAILVAFCVIDIVVYIVYASAAKYFASKLIAENGKNSQTNSTIVATANEQELVTTTRLIVIGSLVGILLQAIGIYGAIRNNLCLSSTYSIAMTVGAVISIVRSYDSIKQHWLNTIWSVAMATTALMFLWDLYYRAQMKRFKRISMKSKNINQEMVEINTNKKIALNGDLNINLSENKNEEENNPFI